MKNPKYLLDEPNERNLIYYILPFERHLDAWKKGKKLGNKLPIRIPYFLLKKKESRRVDIFLCIYLV